MELRRFHHAQRYFFPVSCDRVLTLIQTCFRPVAMMVPDYSLISEIILYSEGFEHAKVGFLNGFI